MPARTGYSACVKLCASVRVGSSSFSTRGRAADVLVPADDEARARRSSVGLRLRRACFFLSHVPVVSDLDSQSQVPVARYALGKCR